MDFLKTLLAYMATTLVVAVESTSTPAVTPIPTPAPTASIVETAVPEMMTELPPETPTPEPTVSVTPVPVPTITPNMRGYHNLLQGDRGEEVRRLQEKLIELGYLPEGSADGAYGGQTRRAVRNFQYYNGLEVDGIAGRTTQTNLFENPDAARYPGESGATEAPAGTPAPLTVEPPMEPAETASAEPAPAAEETTAPADTAADTVTAEPAAAAEETAAPAEEAAETTEAAAETAKAAAETVTAAPASEAEETAETAKAVAATVTAVPAAATEEKTEETAEPAEDTAETAAAAPAAAAAETAEATAEPEKAAVETVTAAPAAAAAETAEVTAEPEKAKAEEGSRTAVYILPEETGSPAQETAEPVKELAKPAGEETPVPDEKAAVEGETEASPAEMTENVDLDLLDQTPVPQPTATPEPVHYEDLAGWVVLNDSGESMQWRALEDGVPVVRSPRLQRQDEDIRVSLDDLCESVESWTLTGEENSLILEAQGFVLALLQEDAGFVSTVDGLEMVTESRDFDFGEGHFIRVDFLTRALDGSWAWDAEEETLMLRIPQKNPALYTD